MCKYPPPSPHCFHSIVNTDNNTQSYVKKGLSINNLNKQDFTLREINLEKLKQKLRAEGTFAKPKYFTDTNC